MFITSLCWFLLGIFVLGDEGSSAFEIEPTSGKVLSKVPFDYEQKHTYNFVVTVRDSGDRRADVQVTVNVESEDEYPPVFAQKAYRFYVSPKAKKDEVVGQVIAHDQDAGPDGAVVYKFQNAPDMLYLNNTTGRITMKMDFQKENDSVKQDNASATEKNVVTPEVSSLVIASSGREGIKTHKPLSIPTAFYRNYELYMWLLGKQILAARLPKRSTLPAYVSANVRHLRKRWGRVSLPSSHVTMRDATMVSRLSLALG